MSALLMGQVWSIELTPPEQTVMLALADHANDDPNIPGYGFDIFPSVELLAWKTGKTPRQIQRILRVLVNKRLITPVSFSAGGRGHATRYEMHLSRGVLKSPLRDVKGDIQGTDDNDVKGDIQGLNTENVLKGDIQGLKGDIQGLKGDIQGLKGDIAMSPYPSYTHHNNHQRTITRTHAKKKNGAEPEPEAEPPPGGADPPPTSPPTLPTFNEFLREYRKAQGLANFRYSDAHRAYYDRYGVTA